MGPGESILVSAMGVESPGKNLRPLTAQAPKAKPAPQSQHSNEGRVADRRNSWQRSIETQKVVEKLQGKHTKLSISVNQDTGTIVVEILDSATGETIRRLPLQDSGRGNEDLKGLFLDTTQ